MRRKPTAEKALAGTLRRDRLNPHEPRPPAGAPAARRGLPRAVRREYDHLVTLMAAMPGVATVCDVVQLELAAAALAEYREAVAVVLRRGQTYKCKTQAGAVMVRTRPEVAIAADAWRRSNAALQNLGLSPVARPKLVGDTPVQPIADDRDGVTQWLRQAQDRRGPARFFVDADPHNPHNVLAARRLQRAATTESAQ
jgi:P27 family predicted phage terminase small subunit